MTRAILVDEWASSKTLASSLSGGEVANSIEFSSLVQRLLRSAWSAHLSGPRHGQLTCNVTHHSWRLFETNSNPAVPFVGFVDFESYPSQSLPKKVLCMGSRLLFSHHDLYESYKSFMLVRSFGSRTQAESIHWPTESLSSR
jgi:hypothetical protein